MRDRALGSTIRIYFTTHQSTGVVVAPSSAFAASDFKIYKDGSSTEKATTNGITVTSPFDSQTGAHLIEVDTSNSTGDSGFWASGSSYRVVISTAKTVDSKDPSGVCVGEFSIELQTADIRKFGGTAGTFSGGRPEVNTTHVGGTIQTAGDMYALLTAIAGYIDTEIAAIKAKTDNLPSDPADASDIAASFASIASTLSTIASYIDTEIAAIKSKTDNLPSDPADQSQVEAAITAAAITAAGIRTALGMAAADMDSQLDAILSASGGGGGGGSGDASQSTLLDVQALVADAIARIDEESYTIGEISEALAGGGGDSVFELLRQLTNSGTGEFTVTITVTDGTNPLQNALVRIIDGVTTYSAITNVSGEVEFQLDAASYVVAISKAGYSYAGTTLVVDDDETASYAMTLNTLVIPSLGQVARRSIPVTVVDRVS